MTILHKTKKHLILLFTISVLFIISACMQYSLVKADKDIKVGETFNVKTPIEWSKSKIDGVETWTIDGPRLQRIMFFEGVKNGEPLLKIKGANKKKLPIYKGSMGALEIMELIETTLTRVGGHHIVTKDLRPKKFGDLEGFRFEFRYQIKSGLKYSGFFAGGKKAKKLLGILYLGTILYHYEKHLDHVENIVSSVKIH